MKIVALDGHTLNPGDNPWDPVAALGDFSVYDKTPDELVLERAAGAQVLLTNKVPLTPAVFDALPDLQFVSVTATGFNVVDTEAARARDIPVSNIPVYGTDSVAQYAMALLLELCHHVGHHDNAVHQGGWKNSGYWSFWETPLMELAGKTIGLIGFGRIGQRVGELAHAFGMEVWAYAPSPKDAPAYAPFALKSVEEIFAGADVVSLHCPQTPENTGFVNANLLATMKEGALFINTGRGGLVDEQALLDALRAGTPRAAATDVASTEPIENGNPLLQAPNLLITPHMAWATVEARKRLMGMTADNIKAFQDGSPINLVN
ncbi:MAG: D-2-hydroxyacid dehydrogenase [Gemmatimonadetes bacterium]|jgi:glycerate dehydrogenase|nr:D-2-hydroxyacid dehydrogenase [Gemmatimonadota bacterium]MBT5327593.1 D-2-hydroxyacid dehydrogenase [Gemmatimonadota bacterium]MBT5451425.1 D-2-hydroxyacid dehydrogenase [Gemmatimonadota bacterium]MBT5805611.1 D-2-hydroxyacid dehydrogenase [Gemmatimonadota bacterium]MBT6618556.1 D-2-hydroxyacid dehydrogenase [Gemmatimonadota bacterium]